MKKLIIAMQFLTRFTITKEPVSEKELGESMAYFPLIGMIIGFFLVLINVVLQNFLPSLVVNSLILVALVILTGAIHLDGFVDTIDGLAVGKDREDILEIMRDSRVGAIGVVAVCCLLITKLSLLYEMPAYLKNSSLILMTVLGRWVMVMSASSSFYARRGSGLGRAFIDNVGLKEFVVASIITALIGLCLMFIKGLILIVIVYPITLLLISLIKKRLDGLTGDTLGWICEITEVVALFGVIVLGRLEEANIIKF